MDGEWGGSEGAAPRPPAGPPPSRPRWRGIRRTGSGSSASASSTTASKASGESATGSGKSSGASPRARAEVALRRPGAPQPLEAEAEEPVAPASSGSSSRTRVGVRGLLEPGELVEGARLLGPHVEVVGEGPGGPVDRASAARESPRASRACPSASARRAGSSSSSPRPARREPSMASSSARSGSPSSRASSAWSSRASAVRLRRHGAPARAGGLRRRDVDHVAGGLLAPVHGSVGQVEQERLRGRVLRVAGEPDGDGQAHREPLAGEEAAVLHRATDALGHLEAAARVDAGEEGHELVPAVAHQHVLVAHAGAEHAAELAEQRRAHEVAVPVVHRLERSIHEEEGEGPSTGQLPVERHVEEPVVVEKGDVVDVGELLDVGEAPQRPERHPQVAADEGGAAGALGVERPSRRGRRRPGSPGRPRPGGTGSRVPGGRPRPAARGGAWRRAPGSDRRGRAGARTRPRPRGRCRGRRRGASDPPLPLEEGRARGPALRGERREREGDDVLALQRAGDALAGLEEVDVAAQRGILGEQRAGERDCWTASWRASGVTGFTR